MDKEKLITTHSQIFQTFLNESQKAYQELGMGWENIRGCEFNINTSINRLYQLINTANNYGYSRKSVLEHWIQEVGEDLKGYTQEYILQTPLSPVEYEGIVSETLDIHLKSHNFFLTKEENRKTSINTIFEIRKMIDTQERGGSVYRGWVKLEELASLSEMGSIIILTSPDGKTGLKDTPNYPYSRTYILQITEDFWEKGKHYKQIKGFDLQSDLSLEEHRQLLNTFLDQNQQLPQTVNAYEIVETPVVFRSGTVKDVINTIKQVRLKHGHEYIYKNRTFAEVYESLNQQTLKFLDPKFEEEFNKFSQIVLIDGVEVNVEIKQALALLIISAYRLDQIPSSPKIYPDQKIDVKIFSSGAIYDARENYDYLYPISYAQAYRKAQENKGSCGGGGNQWEIKDPVKEILEKTQKIINPAIPGINAFNEDKYGSLEFKCPHCEKTITRLKGELIKVCPKCHKDVSC